MQKRIGQTYKTSETEEKDQENTTEVDNIQT